MKKGRHRRFEEARKLKQQGPGAFLGLEPSNGTEVDAGDEDEFADIAERYGAFDDEAEGDDDDAES